MKKINYISGLVVALLLFSSCSSWLDVPSRSEKTEGKLFVSERGFQNALSGAYADMASTNLYGERATMGLPEFLAGHWTPRGDESSTEYRLVNYDKAENRVQDNVRSYIADMWLQYYRTIAQLNTVISHIQNTDVVFSGNGKALIEGEARGLRAFLHLDLLRFFGPMPKNAVATTAYVPYMNVNSRDLESLGADTWAEYERLLRQDLADCKRLLADIDPVFLYTQSEYLTGTESQPTDPFETSRKYRFNYWAAVATEARMEAWFGNTAAAATLAKQVIDAKDYTNGSTKMYKLATASELTTNKTLNSETIFSMQNSDLYKSIENKYKGDPEVMSATGAQTRTQPFYSQTKIAIDGQALYELDKNPNDIRQNRNYWSDHPRAVSVYQYMKYVDDAITQKSQINRVPLIRLAEMYLIYLEGTNMADAQNELADYVAARGLNLEWAQQEIAQGNKMEPAGRIEKEYRKEFYAEGQMFFFYKRLGYESFTWPAIKYIGTPFFEIEKPLDDWAKFF